MLMLLVWSLLLLLFLCMLIIIWHSLCIAVAPASLLLQGFALLGLASALKLSVEHEIGMLAWVFL